MPENLPPKEQGNVLFLILIAVALFAALSYAVTQSTRGGGDNRERPQITAALVSQYFNAIETAITRLKIIKSCDDTELTIENDTYVGGIVGTWAGGQVMLPVGTNPNSPADGSCHVFNPNGGGVSPLVIQDAIEPYPMTGGGSSHSVWWGWPAPGNPWFITQSVPGVGSSEPDLVGSLLYVPEEVCRSFGVQFGDGEPILKSAMGDWIDPPQFNDGTYPNTYGGGWGSGLPYGSTAWCLDGQDTLGTWHIFYVVYAR